MFLLAERAEVLAWRGGGSDKWIRVVNLQHSVTSADACSSGSLSDPVGQSRSKYERPSNLLIGELGGESFAFIKRVFF